MRRLPTARSIWKVIFALTALLEIQFIALCLRKADGVANESDSDGYCRSTHLKGNECSINYTTFTYHGWESTRTISQLSFVWIGPFFCFLCLVEALVQAVEVRKAALDNRALDELEKSLLRAAQRSSVRLSMFFLGSVADQNHKKGTVTTISKFLRSWLPAIATIAFWLFILPTETVDFHRHCGSSRLHDSAVITQWINRASVSLSKLSLAFHDTIESFFWTNILPYRIHKEPQRFIQRLQVILRWIRFARFAGPLFRMVLKLQDQIRAVWQTRIQSQKSEMEKRRRIEKPSMIFNDIQNLLQLAKAQTALARVSSFNFHSSPKLNKISSSVIEAYNKRRVFGKQVLDQLTKLQKDYQHFRDESLTASSDLYDRIVKISLDVKTSINSEKRNYSHRYMKSLRSLLSSRKYLISPRTRFSLAWRMTVTNCLLLEIARLCLSWNLSATFSIPLSQIVGRLFVDCKAPDQINQQLAFITEQINRFRRHIFDILPILGRPPIDIAVCIPSGPQALFILRFGQCLEFFVDAVVFFDIFIWFFTGDIDVDTHAIIPKPFFTRCVLPGTLVQVLDHPTLPDLLPGLVKNTLATCAAIGYSRCIRLILALIPALKMLVLDPLIAYFFKHLEDDGLMHYAESVGMLTPERKSGMMYRSASSDSRASYTRESHFYHRQSTDGFNTSQVGLYFDSSPIPLRSEPVGLKGSMTDGTTERIPSSLLTPTFPGMMSMEHSPLKGRKSVHFGLSEDENLVSTVSGVPMERNNNVGYSLSASELFVSRSTSYELLSLVSTEGSVSDGLTPRQSSSDFPLSGTTSMDNSMDNSHVEKHKAAHFFGNASDEEIDVDTH